MNTETIEKYTAAVGCAHRRSFGQFFTPPDVATFMCRWALGGGARVLFDPALGLGSFYFAAKDVDPSVDFQASEIDPRIVDFLHETYTQVGSISVTREDYLSRWDRKHEAIVCNPPYMRFQLFSNRGNVFNLFLKNMNISLSGYTNIASAFLAKSLAELQQNGRLAYIMPLEFLNTGYGEVIKERLLQSGMLKALIKLDDEKGVFPDATTSVGIILAENDGVRSPVSFYTASNTAALSSLLDQSPTRVLPNADLKPDDKWLKYFDLRPSPVLTKDLVAVNTYGSFSRGIATGANEFFAISASKAAQHNLPRSLFLRSVTKSAQIKKPVFTDDDFDLLEKSDAPVLLLNLNGCISGPARDYIEYGVRQGFHLRYLTKARNPWYKLERRVPAPLLFGVFSRDGFNVVRNKSSALNLTCYHGFNPNLFGRDHVDELFLYFQSRAARRLLELNMRRYGEGLDKFEPNDLNRALAPSPGWFSRLPPRLIQQGMEECENGEVLPEEIEQCFDTLMGSAGGSVSPEDDSVAILR